MVTIGTASVRPDGWVRMLSPAPDLLAEVAPEALDHRRRVGLLDLDQHLPLAAVLGLHAGREVHAQQGQRQVVRGEVRGAGHDGLLRADGERLHRHAGDPADQQAGDAVVLHQVLEDHVVDGIGDVHAGIEAAVRAAGQLAAFPVLWMIGSLAATARSRCVNRRS